MPSPVPVDTLLKILPIQIAMFGAMIAFLNFLPRVHELIEKDPESFAPEKSFALRERFDALVHSKRYFLWSLILLGLSIFFGLTYSVFSTWRLPVRSGSTLERLYDWGIVVYSVLGPTVFVSSFYTVYKWARPWGEYFYQTLSQRRPPG